MPKGIPLAQIGLMLQPFLKRTRFFKPAIAALMALLVLSLGVLASNEEAHFKLHHGDGSHNATCAVCAVAKGLVDAPTPAVTVTANELFFSWSVPISYSAFVPKADFSVASSRGPPAAISSL